MATSVQSEDTIFLLDTSASMYRYDHGEQSRFHQAYYTISEIVKKKIDIDPKDRYAVVTFAKLVHSMEDLVFTEQEIVTYIQQSAEFEHQTALGEALSKAIQLILKQMRFIGQKLSRILIVSDGLSQISLINPMNVAKIAMQLGIIIDVIRFGPAQIPGNLLKKISELTQGDYIYIGSPQELPMAIDRLAKKKEKKHGTIFDKGDDNDVMAQEMMGEIADIPLKLEKMTESQKDQAFYNLEAGKQIVCTICYSNNCMIDKVSFFGCGRFCPNCLTPFHLHCAKMWSEQQNSKKLGGKSSKVNTFRCPHCFYLMKIPENDLEKHGNSAQTPDNPVLQKILSESLTGTHICNTTNCGALIDPKETPEIYQCNACGAKFHQECAKTVWNKDKRCPYCKKLVSIEE